ncbi:MAG TPA: hypothetical protein VKR27_06485, partial [Acidimicrobiales bacterium]|nr:hypothetical protein [Acidimicrobiales bacterium]
MEDEAGQTTAEDRALEALTELSETAGSSAEELNAVKDDLNTMRRRRIRGWSWRRIMSSSNVASNPLGSVSRIAACLGAASGKFRRALARSLQNEGMRLTEV